MHVRGLKSRALGNNPIEGSRDWVREELNCDGVEKEDSLSQSHKEL